MATEILVNDGGAPARILPFVARTALAAGMPVMVQAGTLQVEATDANFAMSGISLTTVAAAGDMCNVISGSGVIVNVLCENGTAIGDYMKVGLEMLANIVNTTTATDNDYVAIALEGSATGGTALTKVLLV